MYRLFSFFLLFFLIIFSGASLAQAASSSTYQILLDALGGGGERSTSSSYTLDDVVSDVGGGQPSSSTYQLREGFPAGATPDQATGRRRTFLGIGGGGGSTITLPYPQQITLVATNRDVTITWVDPANVTRIEILRDYTPSAGVVSGTPITVIEKGVQRFVDTDVEFGKTYQYQLRAFDSALQQAITDIARATISYAAANLPNVAELSALVADRSITLTWKNPTDDRLAAVRVQRSSLEAPASPQEGDTVFEGLGTSVTDLSLENDRAYTYTVFVLDRQGGYSSGAIIEATPRAVLIPEDAGGIPEKITEPSRIEQKEEEAPKQERILPQAVRFTVSATSGGQGTVMKENGATLAVILPPEAVGAASEVAITPTFVETVSQTTRTRLPSQFTVVGALVYDITIHDTGVVAEEEGKQIIETTKPATIVMTYTDKEVAGLDAATLRIWRFDEQTQAWSVLSDSIVNAEARTVIATTTHFSLFTLLGKQIEEQRVEEKETPTPKPPTRKKTPQQPQPEPSAKAPPKGEPKPSLPTEQPALLPEPKEETLRPEFSFEQLKLFINNIERSFDASRPVDILKGSTVYLNYPLSSFTRPPKSGILSFDDTQYHWQKNTDRNILEAKIFLEKEGVYPLGFTLNYEDGAIDTGTLVLNVFSAPPVLPAPGKPWYAFGSVWVGIGVLLALLLGAIFFWKKTKSGDTDSPSLFPSQADPPWADKREDGRDFTDDHTSPPQNDGPPPPAV